MTRPGFEPGAPRWESGDYFFIILYDVGCEAIGTAATPGLLCQPRVIMKMIVDKQMKCRLAGETEGLGKNLPQRHFCPSQNPTWPDPGLNPGRRGGKSATNSLSYGAALLHLFVCCHAWKCHLAPNTIHVQWYIFIVTCKFDAASGYKYSVGLSLSVPLLHTNTSVCFRHVNVLMHKLLGLYYLNQIKQIYKCYVSD
jgi:hypothetical protein